MRIEKNTKIYLGQTEIVKIKKGNVVIWESEPAVEPEYVYIENTDNSNGTITFTTVTSGSPSSDKYTDRIEYSKDKVDWTTLVFDTSTPPQISINVGEKVYLRNNNGKFSYFNTDSDKYFTVIKTSTNHTVGGNINTLLDYRNQDNTFQDFSFFRLFYGDSTLRDASNFVLPATTLTRYCYGEMFYGTSLTSAPALPATNLADSCYKNMFNGCTSLTTAPTTLPATTLASDCYNGMFYDCFSLTTAPTLPATTLADSCYMYMFRNCTSLTTAPELPATTLTNSCYSVMFSGCTSLVNAPALPATTLASSCYSVMFSGCTSLVNAPALPATTLESYCYGEMFNGCTSLTTAPVLPTTTLASDCYNGMFYDCTALTVAPTLPATTLASTCYNNMFNGCISLTTAPELPATTLKTGCYSSMFKGCTSITTAPALTATTLVNNCYQSMFYNCSSLNKVLTYANDISAFNCTDNWLYNVTSSGTLYNGGSAVYTTDSPSGIPTGWSEAAAPALSSISVSPNTFTAKSWIDKPKVSYSITGQNGLGIDIPLGDVSTTYNIGVNTGSSSRTVSETVTYDNVSTTLSIVQSANDTDEPNYFYVETIGSDNVVNVNNYKINSNPVSDLTPTIEYSTDKVNWNTITFDWTNTGLQQTISLNNVGDKVYFRNDTGLFSNSENASNRYKYIYFTFGEGKRVNVGGDLRSLLDYRDVNNANMTKNGMFQSLFSPDNYSTSSNIMMIVDASGLELPATTTQYCYYGMFCGCRALTSTPTLPATTLAENCYGFMFKDCSSLTSAPALPATTLVSYCYAYMFQNCYTLTTAPELPATTLASNCYSNMFNGCQNLTTAPALPATTLASYCYSNMFKGCTVLTTAPTLPATTLATYCYNYMFNGCISLTTPPSLPATTLATYCYYHMFDGCTALTTAPVLTATTLITYCYAYMFQNCSSLTTTPSLPATTLSSGCYNSMFKGCSSLNSVTTFAQNISASMCLYNWLQNVAASGTFNNNGLAEYPSGNSGIPTGWTEVLPIQSIVADPDTFTMKSYQTRVRCESTLTITTTFGDIVTKSNTVTLTISENTGSTTRTLVETIPYKGSSYQVTIVQTANDPVPPYEWEVISDGTYPFELNSNNYYESTNKGQNNSYSYATLYYRGFSELVLECINYGENKYDYGIISQPDVQLSESTTEDSNGSSGTATVFKNFKQESSATPVQLTIPSDKGSHFITIKFRKDQSTASGNDSLQFKVIEPTT